MLNNFLIYVTGWKERNPSKFKYFITAPIYFFVILRIYWIWFNMSEGKRQKANDAYLKSDLYKQVQKRKRELNARK